MVAEAIVERGALDVPRPWPDDLPPDEEGRYYSTYPFLTSAVQLPGKLLLEGIAAAEPGARNFAKPPPRTWPAPSSARCAASCSFACAGSAA